MLSTALDRTAFIDVSSDVPVGKTLREWRRELERERRAARERSRRRFAPRRLRFA